jgi:hypothetical protein
VAEQFLNGVEIALGGVEKVRGERVTGHVPLAVTDGSALGKRR